MRKHFYITLAICGVLTAAGIAAPQFGFFRHSGAVASYVGNSGTNSSIEVEFTSDLPGRLFEVVAQTNGVATAVTVDRLWTYEDKVTSTEVVTNFHGIVLTNNVVTFTRNTQTNRIYDSSSDTLPVAFYALNRDILIFDFGSATNVYLRAMLSTQ